MHIRLHGAAMSLTAMASGFVVLVLSVSVVQGQDGWGVTYTSAQICAFKGSTVDIHCTYTYPPRINGLDTTIERTFWFTKGSNKEPVDLRTDSDYTGRVQYHCAENSCTLTITDLRESDSAVYKFRFIANQDGGRFTGSPGVTVSVTGLQVIASKISKYSFWADLKCHSSCHPPNFPSYIWYRNGQNTGRTGSYSDHIKNEDSISCAFKGHEDFPSPSVCVRGQSCNRVTYTDRNICAFKGSSVDISCTYNGYYHVESKVWFSPGRSLSWRNPSEPEDLREDSEYSGRVEVLQTVRGRSTLRITDLRESDSAEYRFKFKTQWFEWRSSLPGTTLTVRDPDVQVQVIWTSSGVKLICHSSCLLPGRSAFDWFRNEIKIQGETSPTFRGNVDPADSYSCAYEGHRAFPVYAPKAVSVLKSDHEDIMKDSAVSLTCSSDANPPATYTWYEKNQVLLSEAAQLVFNSIQPSDSGEYHCTAESELGRATSTSVFINVNYPPGLPSVSVSPSGQIVEGSSVTLTCSSDANPAAKYTWYKENETLLQGPDGIYHFTSISSEDRGIYYCKTENQHGQINSTFLSLDVQYAPKLPSVSVSPSGQVVEGSSVTLTCSSDANPAANYTWYKENEDSPKASGQIFTITDFRAEHSGNYYCEAQNERGRQNSTLHLGVVAGAEKSAAGATITVFLLAIILLTVFLWIRRKMPLTQQCRQGERPDSTAQLNVGPRFDTPSAAAQKQPAEQQDDLHYASISFSRNQTDAVYSNIQQVHLQREAKEDEEEDDEVEYTVVRYDSGSSAAGTRHQEDWKNEFELYSTVNKNYENTT